MKWIIDAQLPPRLKPWLNQKGEDAVHVFDLENGLQMPDTLIWQYARENQCIIISKDKDFFDFATLFGNPPQTVFISVGNCSTEQLISVLEKSYDDIMNRLKNNSPLIIVTQKDFYSY